MFRSTRYWEIDSTMDGARGNPCELYVYWVSCIQSFGVYRRYPGERIG